MQLLKEVKTIIIPGLGALTLTNQEKGEILFMPYLKFDDGKLATHISEREGTSVQDATNLIAKYVREIEATLNRGESYVMYQFGSFFKQEDGTVSFQNWDKNIIPKEPEIPQIQEEFTPEIVSTSEKANEETVSIQKTYQVSETYSEEDQWNDELDLPPINHKIERPRQPILEKTKKDKPKRKIGLTIGLSVLLLLIGLTLFVSLFYNSTERTAKQLASKNPIVETEKEIKEEVSEVEREYDTDFNENQSSEEEIPSKIEEEETENINIEQSESSELKKYHIIMGAFREIKNAENYVLALNEQGASASIITRVNGLYLVSYGSYETTEERQPHVSEARNISSQAWLMIFP